MTDPHESDRVRAAHRRLCRLIDLNSEPVTQVALYLMGRLPDDLRAHLVRELEPIVALYREDLSFSERDLKDPPALDELQEWFAVGDTLNLWPGKGSDDGQSPDAGKEVTS